MNGFNNAAVFTFVSCGQYLLACDKRGGGGGVLEAKYIFFTLRFY